MRQSYLIIGFAALTLALSACEQGYDEAMKSQVKADLDFKGPDTGTPQSPDLSGTLGDKEPKVDVNVNEALKKCAEEANAGGVIPEDCKKQLQEFAAAAAAASNAFADAAKAASGAMQAAMGSFKMPSFEFSFGFSGVAPSANEGFKLPDGCHADSDVSESITDENLRKAVRGLANKGDSTAIVSKDAAIKLKWIELPYSGSGAKFTSLVGLNCFINLEVLNVAGHDVTSLAPLSGLSHLTSLNISKTKVGDLSPLTKTNLYYLYMNNMNSAPSVKDLQPLFGIESLKGGLVSALDNPDLMLCQIRELQKQYRKDTYDVYCPNGNPDAQGCGQCGDNGYECNTKVENLVHTTVNFNQYTPCGNEAIKGLIVEYSTSGSAELALYTSAESPTTNSVSVSGDKSTTTSVTFTEPIALKSDNPLKLGFKTTKGTITLKTLKLTAVLSGDASGAEGTILLVNETCLNQSVDGQGWVYGLGLLGSLGHIKGCKLDSSFEIEPKCPYSSIQTSLYVAEAGEGSKVKVILKAGNTVLAETAYKNLNGKNGVRTFEVPLIPTASCVEKSDKLDSIVIQFTDSGFVDMDYKFYSLSIMGNGYLWATLNSLPAGEVSGSGVSIKRSYPSDFWVDPNYQVLPSPKWGQ